MKLKINKMFNIPIFTTKTAYFPGDFTVTVDLTTTPDQVSITYQINNTISQLQTWLKEDRAMLYCNVECGNPIFRKTIHVKENLGEVLIPHYDFKNDLEISFVCVAKRAFTATINLDTGPFSYAVDKHQTIGYLPTTSFYLGDEVSKSNFFTISKAQGDKATYTLDDNQLTIDLPKKTCEQIIKYKEQPSLANIMMQIIIEPAVVFLVTLYRIDNEELGDGELRHFMRMIIGEGTGIDTVANDVQKLLDKLKDRAISDLIKLWEQMHDD